MNILFYYPSNQRTISIESVLLKFKEQGHHVILLTQTEEGLLHNELKINGIDAFSKAIPKKNPFKYYFKHIFFLIRFCKKNKIDVVYSHLQQANIISVFAQYFCMSKFYICRHHSSVNGLDKNFNQTLFDKLINFFSKIIIVPSKMVYEQVCRVEGVNTDKVKLINYGYDFNKYPKPNKQNVIEIKNKYNCQLLLIKVARLVSGKRYPILFDVVKKMVIDERKDIKLLVISDGPLMSDFEKYLKNNNLENNIFLLGNVSNVIDYLAASDVVPLLSDAEASNSVIKEAGLIKKAVIVCNNVGDFDDYIVQGKSGLFMNRENPSIDLYHYLSDIYSGKYNTKFLGENLYDSVVNTFSIDNVISSYNELNV